MTFLVILCAFAILFGFRGVKGGIAESVDAPYAGPTDDGKSTIDGYHDDVFSDRRNDFENEVEKYITEGSQSAGHWTFRGFDHVGKSEKQKLEWWQTCVFYEVYVRSFKDTNGNGIGDIRGIIEKIPYLKELGICAIWITPIFKSPGYDLGYDITDYTDIDALYGSMDDFDELKIKLHENGIKIILDFVPNHTSEEHEWFVKSVQKIEPYTDYYMWANAKYLNGTRRAPNNWLSIFGGSMWEWNEQRQQYYLHQFYKQQPDLNFRNPLVSEEIKNVLRFWMDKGVDGFRFDAVSSLYEREDLSDAPVHDETQRPQRNDYTDGLDGCFEEVKAWRAVLDERKKIDGVTKLAVVESYLGRENETKFYGNETHRGAHFPLSLVLVYWTLNPELTAHRYVYILTKYLSTLPKFAWPSWSVGNHDTGRAASRFGEQLVDGIRMMQMLLPGTPVIYQADELGMVNTELREDQWIDHQSKLKSTKHFRERYRTPFQWDSTAQAGFTEKRTPYIPVNPNYYTCNVEYQNNNATRSYLKITKDLVQLRRMDIFRSGDVEFYELSKYVLAISRSDRFFKTFFIVVNLGSEMEYVSLKKLKRTLAPKMTVRVASLNAEQNAGDVVRSKIFTLRPKAALVLESTYLKFNTE